MMKQIQKSFDKKKLPSLPRILFDGRIVVVTTPEETEKAVDYLLSQDILGFDTETRPAFRKGVRYEVSLLQVSTLDTCFLFRLNMTGMTPAIIRLLEDRTVTKIGLSWHDDLLQLHRRAEFVAGNFIELQDEAKTLGITDKSLQKLYANIFGMRISKTQRLSNWEREELREAEVLYAATDAWTCIHLYLEIKRLRETGDYELIVPETDETQQASDTKEVQLSSEVEEQATSEN